MFDLALLAPPGDGAIDALSSYGSVEVVRLWQDWNVYSRDLYITLPDGVTLRDALLDLMEDDRVYRVRLVNVEELGDDFGQVAVSEVIGEEAS